MKPLCKLCGLRHYTAGERPRGKEIRYGGRCSFCGGKPEAKGNRSCRACMRRYITGHYRGRRVA